MGEFYVSLGALMWLETWETWCAQCFKVWSAELFLEKVWMPDFFWVNLDICLDVKHWCAHVILMSNPCQIHISYSVGLMICVEKHYRIYFMWRVNISHEHINVWTSRQTSKTFLANKLFTKTFQPAKLWTLPTSCFPCFRYIQGI